MTDSTATLINQLGSKLAVGEWGADCDDLAFAMSIPTWVEPKPPESGRVPNWAIDCLLCAGPATVWQSAETQWVKGYLPTALRKLSRMSKVNKERIRGQAFVKALSAWPPEFGDPLTVRARALVVACLKSLSAGVAVSGDDWEAAYRATIDAARRMVEANALYSSGHELDLVNMLMIALSETKHGLYRPLVGCYYGMVWPYLLSNVCAAVFVFDRAQKAKP